MTEKKMGRPALDEKDKKRAVNIKFHPNLIDWFDRQSESRAKLIETALCSYYQIDKGVFDPDKKSKSKNKII